MIKYDALRFCLATNYAQSRNDILCIRNLFEPLRIGFIIEIDSNDVSFFFLILRQHSNAFVMQKEAILMR